MHNLKSGNCSCSFTWTSLNHRRSGRERCGFAHDNKGIVNPSACIIEHFKIGLAFLLGVNHAAVELSEFCCSA